MEASDTTSGEELAVSSPPFPSWVRTLIILMVSAAWAVYIAVELLRGVVPSAIVWTVPGATYAALATTGGGGKRRRVRVTLEDDESES